jgi:hypothetical protein
MGINDVDKAVLEKLGFNAPATDDLHLLSEKDWKSAGASVMQ